MNALANSQLWELEKYLRNGYGPDNEPVTFARYTGQESQADRDRIRANPPDILLTNYVMLELMLTRPDDRRSLIRMARGLEFLVFDELHTYRGRQGADVALLIRRVKDACEAENVQCVGTSATMASEGTSQQRRKAVADVAFQVFGAPVAEENIIGETLIRATAEDAGPVTPARIAAPAAPRRLQRPGPRPPRLLDRGQRSASTATTRAGSPAAPRPPSSGRPATWRPRRARTRTSARRRSSAPCRLDPGPGTRTAAGRCSRSGCTSSCPRATPCT